MSKILIIPDAHNKPGVSNERFLWLGRLIAEERPDRVVCLGDFSDMESLSLYDVGKKSFQGRTYKKDVDSAIDAQLNLFKPIQQLNTNLRAKKQKLYNPSWDLTLGNHEYRINRAIQLDSKLDGTISVDDLAYKKFGWNVHDFKTIIDVDGIFITHYFTAGLLDKPIGGECLGNAILKKVHDNAIQGHTHIMSLAFSTLPTGRRIVAGSVGCYFDHKEDYVTARAQSDWARGIMIFNVQNKEVHDYQWISLQTIRKEYK